MHGPTEHSPARFAPWYDVPFRIAELVIAFVFAFGVVSLVWTVGCRLHGQRCVDVSGLPILLLAVVLAIVSGIAFFVFTGRMRHGWRARLGVDLVAFAFGTACYVTR